MHKRKFGKLREFVRSRIYNNDHFRKQWRDTNPFIGTDKEWAYKGKTDFCIGLIYDPAQYHKYWIAACLDLGISYKVVDLLKDNWIEEIENSGCAGFIIWPHINSMVLKDILDERVYLLGKYRGIKVYPDVEGLSLLDNKRRVRDWLLAAGFNPPKTWCFAQQSEALAFAETASFPIIYKTIKGSVSRGVEIINSKEHAIRLINQCFGKGVYPHRMDRRNNQWDFILFQEYLHECGEIRLIRIGDDYLSIAKVRNVDPFHSGSGKMAWLEQNDFLLNRTKEITDKGGFRCMNVDFLQDKNGNYYVNELHALFHGPRIPDSPFCGKYHQDASGKWIFTPGNFYRNYTSNLRVLDLVKQLGLNYADDGEWLKKDIFYEIDGRRL